MASNTLGNFFTVTSFGESHGSYVGCVIDGVPSNIKIDIKKVQAQVNRRKPNAEFATTRLEEDTIEIISGIFNGKTTGAPICILIQNKNIQSTDYSKLKNVFRPNHSDYTYNAKYINRDYKGGGRSSIRITAPLVAAGNIAEQIIAAINKDIRITAFVRAIGNFDTENTANYFTKTRKQIDVHKTRMLDSTKNKEIEKLLIACKKNGDTLGGVITCVINGIPVGIGEPIFEKLQAQLAHAMMSINSVKGFEYGDGFASSQKFGSQHNDAFSTDRGKKIITKTNNSGGIQGGISNGMPVYFNVAFKPISSITKTQQTIHKNKNNITIAIAGRHDVCAVPRAVPIVEAYTAIVLLDLILKNNITQIIN
jgi:chorismate synthase